MKGDLETEKVAIDAVRPHPKNVRQGDIGAICESLTAHGQYRAIVAQRTTGHILAGNHTWKAAKQLGWSHITTHFIDCDDDAAMRILLADNRANDLASYDDAALVAVLQELSHTDDGLAGTLFDGDALDDLISGIGKEIEQDEPPTDAPAITQLGDIWLLGNHRLMCGDSQDIATLDRLMAGKTADAVLTDPPYGINLDTDYTQMGSGSGKALLKGTSPKKYRPVINDDKRFNASILCDYFDRTKEQYWFGADYYRRTIPSDELSGSWLVWDKRNETSDAGFGSGFELIWSKTRHKRDLLRFYHFGAFGAEARNRVHPTQKPVALLSEIITRWIPDNALIVDLFAGSGSTLIAAHQTGRTCYTIELDPHYCDIICARYQKQTGEKPRLEATGDEHNFLL